MLSVADQIFYCAVKVTGLAQGQPTGTGTAFFYKLALPNDKQSIVLVTNKHVLKGADEVQLVLHRGTGKPEDGPSGTTAICRIMILNAVVAHPDPDVDLCAFSISGLVSQADAAGQPLFLVTLTSDNIPGDSDWENFDSIEDVTMVGCPRGIFDEANNIPIVRRGITATPLSKLFDGAKRFMVDMACFPGSSGSPIFVYNQAGYVDRRSNSYVMGQRVLLVGVLFAGPLITNTGKIVLGQPNNVEVATMMHLGYVVRADELRVLEQAIRETIRAAGAQA